MYNFIRYVSLNEGKSPTTLVHTKLPYARDDLEPSMSEDTIDYHYDELYGGYVKRFNKGEGDADFNEAGAFLHNIWFTQFQKPTTSNEPNGSAGEFITKHFKTFDKFKDAFEKEAMKIQGSGWAYLARDGKIKTIANHQIKQDIVLLVDWWEHAWALDYQSDKKSYLTNQWKIINWNVISARVGIQTIVKEDKGTRIVVVGDSIALGLSKSFPTAQVDAIVGRSTKAILSAVIANKALHSADLAIVSAGTNDYPLANKGKNNNPDATIANIENIKAILNAKQYLWVLPFNPSAAEDVKTAIGGDPSISLAQVSRTEDKLHPTSYAAVASAIKSKIGLKS
jgi:Fe-Mn family superoxide dismutase